MWKVITKSGSEYVIRQSVEEGENTRYYLRANNVPNARFDRLGEWETEIYVPRVQPTYRDETPWTGALRWYDAVGYHLNFIEVFDQPTKLFPHGEIVCSRVVEIQSSEVV